VKVLLALTASLANPALQAQSVSDWRLLGNTSDSAVFYDAKGIRNGDDKPRQYVDGNPGSGRPARGRPRVRRRARVTASGEVFAPCFGSWPVRYGRSGASCFKGASLSESAAVI
jgi:hypothetical protein